MLYLKISLCENTKLRLFLFIHHSPNMVFPYHIYGKGAGGVFFHPKIWRNKNFFVYLRHYLIVIPL